MFVLNGVEYKSRTAAAVALVNDEKNPMDVKVAAATVGIAYQTVYVNTVGKENRLRQMAKLQAKRLIASKRKYTKAEIARRTGLGEKTVRKLFTVVAGDAPVVATVVETAAE